MKITCKNSNCKHYYNLNKGQHCMAEETCKAYSTNRKKSTRTIVKCKECEHCKKICTNNMTEYHYECTHNGSRRLILLIEERICDRRL